MATETGLRTEFDVYVLTPDGWGGNLAIGAFDSAPQNWSNRAFDVTFRGDGTVDLYDGSTFQDSGLNAAFGTDAWNHVVIDTNFATDTWSIQIGIATVSGIGFEGNADLSKIQNFILSATDRGGLSGRGGFDNLRLQSVPEPSAFALLTAGVLGLLAYAWRKRK